MALQSDLVGAGLYPLQAELLGDNIVTVAGAGTTQGAGTTIVPGNTIVLGTTAGGALAFTISASWPLATALQFTNTSSTTASLFPPTGAAINGGSTNAAISVPQNVTVELTRVSTTSFVGEFSASGLGNFTALTVSGSSQFGGDATMTGIVGFDASLGITGLAAAQGGAVALTGGASSTSANAGGAVTLAGGAPGATGVGGAVTLTGAAGGATSGAGGAVTATAGAGTAGNGNGGAVILTAGAQHGSGMQGSTFQRGKQNLVPQGAPTAKTVTAAITAAELATGIITTTGATGPSVHQLPTGTLLLAEFPGAAAGDAFDFSVINTGTGASDDATITVNTDVTIVGNATIGSLTDATIISGSGRFRARYTGGVTWIVYRLS